jgi:hypothetical protein
MFFPAYMCYVMSYIWPTGRGRDGDGRLSLDGTELGGMRKSGLSHDCKWQA